VPDEIPFSVHFGVLCSVVFILAAILSVHSTDATICGGTVSVFSFSIAAADRIPAAMSKTAAVAFTTATLLASGDLVTIT
jgi:hypothetical protein